MAVEILMRVHPSATGLIPVSQQEADTLETLRQMGGVLNVKVTQRRANRFHRKGMALFRYLFGLWEPAETTADGLPIKKDFDSFRDHLVIQAGFFTQVYLPGGGFELRADSLKWSAMDNIRFAQVYSAVIDVAMRLICNDKGMTAEQIDLAVEHLLGFA